MRPGAGAGMLALVWDRKSNEPNRRAGPGRRAALKGVVPLIRSLLIRSLLVTVILSAAIGVLYASTGESATRRAPHHPAAASGSGDPDQVAGPAAVRPARPGVIGAHLHVSMSPAQLSAAATRCARWASRAGFANNGYVGGSLTTAVAIALAESGCNPSACFNDTTRRECTAAGTRGSHDSIDRGAWQINSHAWRTVSDSCAYRGLCNARVAYRQVSAYGSYFGPWTTYLTDHYAGFLWAAQQGASAISRGTLASAMIGSCAAHRADKTGAAVRLANCGNGATSQQWTVSGRRLRTGGGLCLAATSGRPGTVVLRRCSGSRFQQWQQRAGSTLYNTGARLCLTDPGAAVHPGVALVTRRCGHRQDEAWFRP